MDFVVEAIGITALFALGAWFYMPQFGYINSNAAKYIDDVYAQLNGGKSRTFASYQLQNYQNRQAAGEMPGLLERPKVLIMLAWLLVYVMPIVNLVIGAAGLLSGFFYVYGLIKVDTAVALYHWWFVWLIAAFLFVGSGLVIRHYNHLYSGDYYAQLSALPICFAGGFLVTAATALCGVLAFNGDDFASANTWINGSFVVFVVYTILLALTSVWAVIVVIASSRPEHINQSGPLPGLFDVHGAAGATAESVMSTFPFLRKQK